MLDGGRTTRRGKGCWGGAVAKNPVLLGSLYIGAFALICLADSSSRYDGERPSVQTARLAIHGSVFLLSCVFPAVYSSVSNATLAPLLRTQLLFFGFAEGVLGCYYHQGAHDSWMVCFAVSSLLLNPGWIFGREWALEHASREAASYEISGHVMAGMGVVCVLALAAEQSFEYGLFHLVETHASSGVRVSGFGGKLLLLAHGAVVRLGVLLPLVYRRDRNPGTFAVVPTEKRGQAHEPELSRIADGMQRLASAMARFDLNLARDALEEVLNDTSIAADVRRLCVYLSYYRPFIPEGIFSAQESARVVARDGSRGDGLTAPPDRPPPYLSRKNRNLSAGRLGGGGSGFGGEYSAAVVAPAAAAVPPRHLRHAYSTGSLPLPTLSASTATFSHRHTPHTDHHWKSLEDLEYLRQSSLHGWSVCPLSNPSFRLQGLPETLFNHSRTLAKKQHSVCAIRLDKILDDIPDDLLLPSVAEFLSQCFDCLQANQGVVRSFESNSVLSTFVRASDACRASLAVRAGLGSFLKKNGAFQCGGGGGAACSRRPSTGGGAAPAEPAHLYIGIASGWVHHATIGVPDKLCLSVFGRPVVQARGLTYANHAHVAGGAASSGDASGVVLVLCTHDIEVRVRGEVTVRQVVVPEAVKRSGEHQRFLLHGSLADVPLYQVTDALCLGVAETLTSKTGGSHLDRPLFRRADPDDAAGAPRATHHHHHGAAVNPLAGHPRASLFDDTPPRRCGCGAAARGAAAAPPPPLLPPTEQTVEATISLSASNATGDAFPAELDVFHAKLRQLGTSVEELSALSAVTLHTFIGAILTAASEDCIMFIADTIYAAAQTKENPVPEPRIVSDTILSP
ncbi:hypothetical protein DIPPA_26825 [Diplonema papillatum]|nr:hypothetical protein DIPPA_26825 [Diplonema papillatum]